MGEETCNFVHVLNTQLPAALLKRGFTDAEAAIALRDGGPLDEIRHRTWCEGCKRSIEATLRQLLSSNGKCACGGNYHVSERHPSMVDEIVGRLAPGT